MENSDVSQQDESAPQPRSTRKTKTTPRQLLLNVGLVVLTASFCMVCALAVIPTMLSITTGLAFYAYIFEKPRIQQVLNEYMLAQSQGDFDAAAAFWSTKSLEQVTRSQIETMFYSDYGFLLDGYQAVEIDGIEILSDPVGTEETPPGLVAKVDGRVILDSGWEGALHAVLERESGDWRIYSIRVEFPPFIGYP